MDEKNEYRTKGMKKEGTKKKLKRKGRLNVEGSIRTKETMESQRNEKNNRTDQKNEKNNGSKERREQWKQ